MSKRSPTARAQPQPGPAITGICSLRHRTPMGSEVFASFKLGVGQFTKCCVASCPCLASCDCCHDPFIVRKAQTRPPFTGFTQPALPSRCSRSTLTTVCFCARASLGLCVHIGFATPVTRSIIGSSPSSCSGVCGSMVSGISILQTCNVVALLKQRLVLFEHLRSSSP